MDQDKDCLPLLDLNEARLAKTPFRLTKQARQSFRGIKNMSNDTIQLVRSALLCDGSFSLAICDDEDQQFAISILKEHKKIDYLTISIQLGAGVDEQLAEAIQSSQIFGISIHKINPNTDQLLPALANMNMLRKLSISFSIPPEEYELFARVVQNNEHLETLQLVIRDMPGELMTSLVPAISTHRSLKNLLLNPFGGHVGLQATCEILRKNSSIRQLTFGTFGSGYQTTAEEMRDLCSALAINKSLQMIDFSSLPEAVTTLFFESLAHNQSTLTTVSIDTTNITANAIRALIESLKTNTTLTALNFADCDINESTCQLLCEGILRSQNKTLIKLSMSLSTPGVLGTKAICELIKHNRLTELSLICCYIYSEECKLIAQMLAKNTSLVNLSLEGNQFRDEGLLSICEALTTNTTLRSLDVGYLVCKINGLTGVKNMLTRNTTLRRLSISIDYKNEEFVSLICEGLKNNNSLTHLQCKDNNRVDKATCLMIQRKMAEALQDNYALDEVELNFYCQDYAHLLRRNRQLKSSIKFLVAILSHNIALSSHALTILPREIWKKILSSITSPGMEAFNDFVETIFNS